MKPKLILETINALTEHPRKEQSFDQIFFFFCSNRKKHRLNEQAGAST
jgi:hypothetical protein